MTKRESILEAIVTALASVTSVTGVYRSRDDALAREEAPALVVQPQREAPRAVVHAYTEKDLLVSISVYTRGAAPDQAADPICAQVYALLLGNPTLGGLAIDTTDEGTTWQIDQADTTACWTELTLKVWYRHPLASLS